MKLVPRLLGSLCVLALAALFLSATGDPRLDRARELFRDGGEGTCREAAKICAEVNTVEAVEVMLDVFRSTGMGPSLPAGHYRDIVWEQAVNITDPYAKQRFELELKKNKKSAWVREWCAELLGVFGDQDFAPSLTHALKDKDAYVQAAAAQALGRLPLPINGAATKKAQKALAKVAGGKHPYARANAWISLMQLAPAPWQEGFLHRILGKSGDKDGGARCAMLGAYALLAPKDFERVAALALEDEDWRVRLQAVQLLMTAGSKTAVDRIVDATEDGRPRIRVAAVTYLQELTGQGHRDARAWRAWWTTNRETFTFPEGTAEGAQPLSEGLTVAAYNGIRVDSDHVAFLIDKSAAMTESLSSQGMSKEMFAQKQLDEVLNKLPEGVIFNVYTYELRVQTFAEKGPVKIGKKNIKKALEFAEDQPTQGSKDIWQALELVVSDPEIDTIYLLSSGEPDTGKYVHANRVATHLQDLNRFHKVVVHTIAYTSNEGFQSQMEAIARAGDGEFKAFE